MFILSKVAEMNRKLTLSEPIYFNPKPDRFYQLRIVPIPEAENPYFIVEKKFWDKENKKFTNYDPTMKPKEIKGKIINRYTYCIINRDEDSWKDTPIVQIFPAPKTVHLQILDVAYIFMQEEEINIMDHEEGIDFHLIRKGTGLDTRYSTQIPRRGSHPSPIFKDEEMTRKALEEAKTIRRDILKDESIDVPIERHMPAIDLWRRDLEEEMFGS